MDILLFYNLFLNIYKFNYINNIKFIKRIFYLNKKGTDYTVPLPTKIFLIN